MSRVERAWVIGRVVRVIGLTQPNMTVVTEDGRTLRGLVPAGLRKHLAGGLVGRWVEFRAGVVSGRWCQPTEARLMVSPVPVRRRGGVR